MARGCLLNPQPSLLIQIAEIGDNALAWATRGALRFNKRPVGILPAIDSAGAASEIHAIILLHRKRTDFLHYMALAAEHQCRSVFRPLAR